jgi:hypothetical protein
MAPHVRLQAAASKRRPAGPRRRVLMGLLTSWQTPLHKLGGLRGAVPAGRTKLSEVPLPRAGRLREPAVAFFAALRRGLRRWHRARRVVKRWWASHALEAVLWMLGLALSVFAGLIVIWI